MKADKYRLALSRMSLKYTV